MADEKRPQISTSCHDCRGGGWIPTATMVLMRGAPRVGTQFGQKPCKTCRGTGRLSGLVPPM